MTPEELAAALADLAAQVAGLTERVAWIEATAPAAEGIVTARLNRLDEIASRMLTEPDHDDIEKINRRLDEQDFALMELRVLLERWLDDQMGRSTPT